MKKISQSRRRERGVALLFSLGILSLLLFIGLAFVADSVVALKSGAASSGRAAADILARSALHEAGKAIHKYKEDLLGQSFWGTASADDVPYADASGSGAAVLADYSTCVSFYSSGHDANAVGGKSAATALPFASVFRNLSGTGYADWYASLNETDALRNPEWTYVTNDESGADLRLTGRYAYRVLPPASSTQLNLGWLLMGKSVGLPAHLVDNEGTFYDFAALYAFRGDGLSDSTVLQMLNEGFYTDFRKKNPSAEPPDPAEYEKHELVGAFDLFFNAVRKNDDTLVFDTDAKRNWMRRFFSDSMVPGDLDVFRVTGNGSRNYYYHRFPITCAPSATAEGDYKAKWDSVFGDKANTTADLPTKSIENLVDGRGVKVSDTAFNPFPFYPTNTSVAPTPETTDDFSLEPKTTNLYGLNFFKLIGDTPASFADLATRRDQIAANFLDYCDSDSVPTSDIKPAEWSVTAPAKYPTYTGNERTPYINELAIGVNPQISFAAGSGDFASQPVKLQFTGTVPTALVELVQIYQEHTDDTIGVYKAQGQIKKLEVTANVSTQVKIDFEYEKQVGSNPATWESATLTYDVTNKALGKITLTTAGAASTYTIPFTGKSNDAGYYLAGDIQGNSSFDTVEVDLSTDLRAAIDTAVSGYANSTGNIRSVSAFVCSGVRYDSLNVALKLAPVMLLKQDGANEFGVDFVRMDYLTPGGDDDVISITMTADASPYYPGGAAAPAALLSSDSVIGATLNLPFFIGGFEARDPRQNLNPRPSTSGTASDWRIAPAIVFLDGTASANPAGLERLISMHFIASDYTKAGLFGATPPKRPEERVTKGLVNHRVTDGVIAFETSIANPANPHWDGAPIDANPANVKNAVIDRETVTDPAWLGTADNQHLSTAFIRNAPMQSFWEFGAIHRAEPWQTINLHGAALISGESSWQETFFKLVDSTASIDNDPGTTYKGGDGAILDLVKIHNTATSYGMFDLNMLRTGCPGHDLVGGEFKDDVLFKRLLEELGQSTPIDVDERLDLYSVKNETTADLLTDSEITNILNAFSAEPEIADRSRFIEVVRKAFTDPGDSSLITLPGGNKRALDELFGKIMPLLKAEPAWATTVSVDVIAQTIRDVGGSQVVARFNTAGERVTRTCEYGTFDIDANGVLFDEITGEAKLRAIFEVNPWSGKVKLRQMIPLD